MKFSVIKYELFMDIQLPHILKKMYLNHQNIYIMEQQEGLLRQLKERD